MLLALQKYILRLFMLMALVCGFSIAAFSTPAFAQNVVIIEQEVVDAEDMEDEEDDDEDEDDEDEDEDFEVQNNPWGVDPAKLYAAKKFHLQQVFLVEVEHLESVCSLDKKQVLKLKVATKGAVKKLVAEWQKKNDQQMGQFGMQVNQPKKKKKKKKKKEIIIKDADEIDQNTMQFVTMNMFGGNPYKKSDARDERIWKNTVENILDEEQKTKFKAYNAERSKLKSAAMIDYLLASIVVELSLNDEQKASFEKLLRPQLEDKKIDAPTMYEPYVVYYYASKIDGDELEKILSHAQLQKWKLFVSPSKQIGQMMEMEDNAFIGAPQMAGGGDFFSEVEEGIERALADIVSLFDGFVELDE